MEKYRYIFVVLVYRNTEDLKECLESIQNKVSSYKVIVVNAYYDEPTKRKVEKISKKYNCDFINIENKGYGFGNNCGIAYARANYDFEYIVISNPDVVIAQFDESYLDADLKYDIIAPKIKTTSGRMQNPMAFISSPLSEYLIYKGFKNNLKLFIFCGIFLSKLYREFFLWVLKFKRSRIYQIYAAHGSFVILRLKAIETLYPVYDENIFLFAEEILLARKAKRKGLRTCYCSEILINHKEDGSMKLSDFSIEGELKKSNVYYYETYVLKKDSVDKS